MVIVHKTGLRAAHVAQVNSAQLTKVYTDV